MPALFSNTASAELASSISTSATAITVSAGQGAMFPTVPSGSFFYATFTDSSNNLEIVKVTARNTDTLTVVRAQEDTTARTYSAGDKVELRLTAAGMNNFVQLDGAQTITGEKTFSGALSLSGALTVAGPTVYTTTSSVILPSAASPAQTASGSVVWSSATKELTVGDGVSRKTLVDLDTAQTLQNKTLTNTSLALADKALTTTGFIVKEVAGALVFQRNTPSVVAAINATTMTVTSATPGDVQPGQTIVGTGVAANSTVVSQITSNETVAATTTLASGGITGFSTFVVASATGIAAGQLVVGTGVPAGTYVSSDYTGGTTISLVDYLNTPVLFTTTGTGTYTFYPAGGDGTYVITPSQTVSSASVSGVLTIASISAAGNLRLRGSVTSGATI